jgi:hypothetical protein
VVKLVDHAGAPFRAAAVRARLFWVGEDAGTTRVGPVTVRWRYRHPQTVMVAHPTPASIVAALMGVQPGREEYDLRLLRDATPTGGARWWWACPGCGRRCGLLYLLQGRPRLACRLCHGLTYLSQRRPPRRRRRAGYSGGGKQR